MNSGLNVTLAIGAEEARNGTQRTLTLPDGKRVAVVIPAGMPDGYLFYLDSQGNTHGRYDLVGAPALTITVRIETGARPNIDLESGKETARGVFYSPPVPSTSDSVPPALESTRSPSNNEPIFGSIPPPPPPPSSYPQPSPAYPQPSLAYPQPSPLPPTPVPRRSRKLVLMSLIAICLIGVVGVIGIGAYQNNVKQVRVAATATAQANAAATTTALARSTAAAIAAATASAVATNPYPSYLPGSGTLALSDPLARPLNWSDVSDTSFGGGCQFAGGAFQASEGTASRYYECTSAHTYSNFAFLVQMRIQQGDCGGMTFRDDAAGKHYRFILCQDGSYALELDRDLSGNNNATLGQGSLNNTIAQNQSVSMAVVAKGASIGIYYNGQQIINVNDSSYNSGELGLLAESVGHKTVVAYSNARVWTL